MVDEDVDLPDIPPHTPMTTNNFPVGERYSSEESSKWTFIRFLINLFTQGQWKPTVILLYMAVALCSWKCLPIKPDISCMTPNCWTTFLFGSWKIGTAFTLFGLIPAFIVKWIFREHLSDYGLQWGNLKRGLVGASILTPFMIVLGATSCGNPGFYIVYPLNPAIEWATSWTSQWYIAHSFMYAFLYYWAYEFFFRGFLLKGLTPYCGVLNALLIQAAVAAFFHFGHPGTEMWGAFGGSLLWGIIAFRTKSILSSWIQHSSLGIALDWGMQFWK